MRAAWPLVRLGCLLLALLGSRAAVAAEPAVEGEAVTLASSNPFSPAQARGADPATVAATYFPPATASSGRRAPAVVLLHGSGGLSAAREGRYARMLQAQGTGALVVDTYGSRRAMADTYVERVLAITETMFVADAYAGLAWLAARPEIDRHRVVLAGFSYGGLATMLAANAGVADRLARTPARFAGHVAYYAPCIGEFEDPRTTGAPVLMMVGTDDETADLDRCRAAAEEFRRGGSAADLVVYEGAAHQWDGVPGTDWRPSRGIRRCRFRVEADGTVRDARTRLAMTGKLSRTAILTLCTDGKGYRIKADPTVRDRSDAELLRFLARVAG